MAIGLVGRKVGMTRLFQEDGQAVPVTVIEVEANRVTQVKTLENDGYRAIQVTTGSKRSKLVNKPQAGHFAKAGVEAGRGLWEFRLKDDEGTDIDVGKQITVEIFTDGQKVDVAGTSKGKGFQGGVKRWNFRTQDATHGNSLAHRAPGSIGAASYPARVFKGMRMAGQMGNEKVKVQNLRVLKVVPEKNLLVVKGCVPGHKNAYVTIQK